MTGVGALAGSKLVHAEKYAWGGGTDNLRNRSAGCWMQVADWSGWGTFSPSHPSDPFPKKLLIFPARSFPAHVYLYVNNFYCVYFRYTT